MFTSTAQRPTGIRLVPLCDRCSARGQVQVLLTTGGELVFCQHHARQHRAALRSAGAVVTRTGR